MRHGEVLQQQRDARGEHGQIPQAHPRVRPQAGERGHGLERKPGAEAQNAGHQELHDREQCHVATARVLRRVQHMQAEEERRQQRDQVAEAQRESREPRERDAAHAGHAHEGGGDVETRRPRPAQRPSQKRDDHTVQRREKRAVRGGGVGEPRGVRPVREEQEHAQDGALFQVVEVQRFPEPRQHDDAQNDARRGEAHAHEPCGRELVDGRLDDHGAQSPDGSCHQEEGLVHPKRMRAMFHDACHSAAS